MRRFGPDVTELPVFNKVGPNLAYDGEEMPGAAPGGSTKISIA